MDGNVVVHLSIAAFACALLFLLGQVERSTFLTNRTQADTLLASEIVGIEHAGPVDVSVLVARKGEAGYVTVANESAEAIGLTLPGTWHRTEVSGAPLEQVTSELQPHGDMKWMLPGNTTIKLMLVSPPDLIEFINTAETTSQVSLTTVDLLTNASQKDVVLVLKNAKMKLWGQEIED